MSFQVRVIVAYADDEVDAKTSPDGLGSEAQALQAFGGDEEALAAYKEEIVASGALDDLSI